MARKPRVEYAGAFYHVICRGNQRQMIFRRDVDREYYLERLEEYRQRYGSKVYAYVLMSNHLHLLIETGAMPLSKIMQGLQLRYTGYYNRKYKKVGHLFQGRYKAILCDRQAYLLELVRYLHLNPGTDAHSGGPMDLSVEQPWCVYRKEQFGGSRSGDGFGSVGQFGRTSQTSLLEIYGGRKRVGAPGGLL